MSGSSSSGAINIDKFKLLLARAKSQAAANNQENADALTLGINSLSSDLQTSSTTHVDTSSLGISSESLDTVHGRDEAVSIVQDVAETLGQKQIIKVSEDVANNTKHGSTTRATFEQRDAGVARDVTLNERQQQFITTMLSGEDCCLIGSAGTGKTTCTGKAIKMLVDSGKLKATGASTKWLRADTLGVVITSFTRKAVNNIRRATPDELKAHVITLHKLLEFAPVFDEIIDPKSGAVRKTMSFEPTRTKINPLPSGMTHVFFEESSMIGTDLYNLFVDACPHMPQEIFIGDIKQLPPIFGPAILGFKMAMLPIIELNEVYRQALLSPITRLCVDILTGDPHKFDPKQKIIHQKHPYTGKMVDRKTVPALEKYNEVSEHGALTIQVWQKSLSDETACNTMVQQFIAWEKEGYYRPNDDIILCPFNKSFGTLELNRGISQYLGRKRGATIHEVVAGFETHYLAIGDRVLYDKEDAFIEDIRRNPSYLGKSPQVASEYLDRWGTMQKPLDSAVEARAAAEEAELTAEALDAFMDSFGGSDDEDRVNQASHEITIRFAVENETATLRSSGEINNLLGGYCLTVHKMQGSENPTIFICLHKSHATMIQQELLYTAVSRAKFKLHIICETDTFAKGVKSQKVKGNTLEQKIKYFQGTSNYETIEAEMQMLRARKGMKQRREQESQVSEQKMAEAEQTSKYQGSWRTDCDDLDRHDTDYDAWSVEYHLPERVAVTDSTVASATVSAPALTILQKLELLKKQGLNRK